MKKHKALLKVIKEVGSATKLAKELNVSLPHLSNWVNGRRKIPATKVRFIVKLSNGKVTEDELRGDVFYDLEEK